MDRRQSLKLIAIGVIAAPAVIAGCKTDDKKAIPAKNEVKFNLDRSPDELRYEKELLAREKFFTEHEMTTITILADIIIPKDELSGSASEAKVPDFIEFIVKDMPEHQTPLRGGLRWLDIQCMKRYDKSFKDCNQQQRIGIIDEIAYPEKSKSEMQQGVAFFSLMRSLTASGFYTSAIGLKDVGYAGNQPNQWNGVPEDELKRLGFSYSDKELQECI